jgi:hypothetical protein
MMKKIQSDLSACPSLKVPEETRKMVGPGWSVGVSVSFEAVLLVQVDCATDQFSLA